MAKTIMISNDVYKELKTLKRDKSFSELLKDLLNPGNVKKGSSLKDCLGLLKKDKEWEEIEKDIKRGWKSWSKKYA
ncbi:antitoxin [Candidatus Woesearchaeota archaeon]|nr:antitoxin [Candidatus Woesearchaeota archaeon]